MFGKEVMKEMNRREVQRYVEKKFTGWTAKSKMAVPYRNSRIIQMELTKEHDRMEIVVKIARNFQKEEVAREYANLSRFHRRFDSPVISSPQPLFVDETQGILAMSHVQGENLAHVLHEIRPKSQSYISSAIDLSASALARYHEIFSRDDDADISIDRTAREKDINEFLASSRQLIKKCNLNTMVTPFFDFTPWNIIIHNKGAENHMKLYLIDFPRREYVCTPHLDLARFRFALELIKQFPPAKLLGINRWDADRLFDRFLERYCAERQMALNADDLSLIVGAKRAYIRRAQDLKRKGELGWQPKLERAYLQTFSKKWLDQNDEFSRWPESR
jgi:hypothetical protein